MSNIDKQALRQTAEKAQEHGVFNMDIHSQTVLELLDELEAETSYREGAFIACNLWHDKFRETEAKLEAAEKRIAELEARMVKLPERYEVDMCPTPSPNGEWFSREDVLAALVSADVSYAAVNGKGE